MSKSHAVTAAAISALLIVSGNVFAVGVSPPISAARAHNAVQMEGAVALASRSAAVCRSPSGRRPQGPFPHFVDLGRQLVADVDGGNALAVSERTGHVFVIGRRQSQDSRSACSATVFTLSAQKGTVLLTSAIVGDPVTFAIDERSFRLFVASFIPGKNPGHGSLTLLDTRTGRVIATTSIGGIPSALVVATKAGRVFVQTYDPRCRACSSQLHMIDAATGTLLGTTSVGSAGRFASDEQAGQIYIFVGAHLTVLKASTGRTVEQRDLSPCGWGIAMIQSTRRLFTTTGGSVGKGGAGTHGYFCVVDSVSRRVLSTVDEGMGILLKLLAVDEPARTVLASVRGPRGSDVTELLDAADGTVMRQLDGLQGALAVAVHPRTGRAYVLYRTSATGYTVSALDPNGWRITQISRGLQASSIAIAAQARRVFLANPYTGRVIVLCSERRC